MPKKKISIFLALIMVMGLSSALWAAPMPVTNTRPVPVNISPGEPSLQSRLDIMWGAGTFNAVTDQNPAAVFSAAGNPPFSLINPMLAFEFSGVSDTHIFGLWTGYDTDGPITRVPILLGNAVPITIATVNWTSQTGGVISGGAGVNAGAFNGINKDFFGFYYDAFNNPLYTVDALNPVNTNGNRADVLAYNYKNVAWTFAFDDGRVDCDYNDLVVKVESISPVPIPGGILLLGSALLGLVGLRRKL